MSITAWEALARSVTSRMADDPVARARMVSALGRLGLEPDERQALQEATTGRQDPSGLLLRDLVASADPAPEGNPSTVRPWGTAQMDEAIAAAEQVRSDPGMAFAVALEALPPDRAGDLVADLVRSAMAAGDPELRDRYLDAAVEVSHRAPMTRLPVAELVAAAVDADHHTIGALGVVLGQAPRTHVLRGLAASMSAAGADGPTLATLVEAVRWPQPEQMTGAEPPSAAPESAPPPPAPAPAPEEAPVYRSGRPPATADGEDAAGAPPAAYPLVDLRTGTERPDVVVLGQEFTVTVGLAPRPTFGIVSAGALTATGPELEAVLVYDPGSLTVEGGNRHPLRVTADNPYPTVDVAVTAAYVPDAPAHRRIGVQYVHRGQVVGMAWRSFAVVDSPALVDDATAPPQGERELLDLGPLLDADAPDLVVAVVESDTAADRWIWTVYSRDPDLPVPDAPNAATLDGDVAGFALATRRAVQYSGDPVHDYYTLTGRARRIGASMPPVVHRVLTALLHQPGRTTPPTVLLLTEELLVPWELASLDPAPQTPWGGSSAFLGAHVALGRWPLSEHRPRPVPRSSVRVRSAAVVTGDYTGVPGWGRLQHAEAEAEEVAALFSPPATRVGAELLPVIELLRGRPPADIIHVALHGQFDHQGEEEGIVLVRRTGATAKPQFLTPVQVENGHLPGAFVFLNACQVGADERVLGSYGGFASTLLRIGAAGTVAPLWNVEDKVAADIARRMYAETLGPEAVPVAEAVRRIRATYTEEAVVAGASEGTSATLVAFQVFGHPRLTLRREP